VDYDKRMSHPSNGVSILGYLRPAYADEESYTEDSGGYSSDWKGISFLQDWHLRIIDALVNFLLTFFIFNLWLV
jgi:hypothetical protein